MSILAIDPGLGGGWAFLDHDDQVSCGPMPDTEGSVIDLLKSLCALGGTKAFIEEVGNGIIPGRAKAMIALNMNAAICRTVLACCGVPVIKIKPRDWQAPLGLGTRASCVSDTIWKNRLKSEAQRRYPTLSITLKTADALLLLSHVKALP